MIAPVGAVAGRAAARLVPMFDALTRAWRSLSPRHWWLAAGIGALYGMAQGMVVFLSAVAVYEPATWPSLVIIMPTRWTLLMAAVACVLAFALALLHDIGLRRAIRPRDVALTILAVMAAGAALDPLSLVLVVNMRDWLHVTAPFLTEGSTGWLTSLIRMWTVSMEKVITFITLVTLSMVYVRKSSRSFNVLAAAQLRLSESRRRILAEELRAAQAAVDPAFLFGVLGEVDRRFEDDPQVARQLLDGLIRYLRAALPDTDDVIGTLGQQAALVRAWLDIEAIRSAGRVQGHIDVPAEMEPRPFAPALLLPLVALATRGHDGFERDVRLQVRVRIVDRRLIVEVHEDGSERGPGVQTNSVLESLRHRLVALYGSGADLSFVITEPRGSRASIVIDDPGTP